MIVPRPRRPRSRMGFTLLEILISAIILGGVVASSLAFLLSSERWFASGLAADVLDQRARDLVEQIGRDLRQAGAATLIPPNPDRSTTVAFQQPTGYADDGVAWGPVISYGLVETPGAAPFQSCVRTSGGRGIALGGEIVPGGLTFTLAAEGITIALTLQRALPSGETLVRSAATTVRLRN